ncbi:TerD family protein [Nocardia sp. NPDC006630]|uniref:TerD family protein n=1 Tax=Nocardia sp. NPDC006630 TaxID=3157181 RepID=UPI0033B51070
MARPRLSKGQNLPLPGHICRVEVLIGWADSRIELDASALLLGADGKVFSDRDFVFFNQSVSLNGSVRFLGSAEAGEGSQARIAIDLSAVPRNIQTVALVGSLASGTFGALGKLTFIVVDGAGRALAEYIIADAFTESALQFGEVYRRGDGWKIRAVGQGWTSGLAGLATDFGVEIDDDPETEPIETRVPPADVSDSEAVFEAAPTRRAVGTPYRLWTQARTHYDYDVAVERQHLPAIRSLYPQEFSVGDRELTLEVELVPEPEGAQGLWTISVRSAGQRIGYIGADEAQKWAGVIRRIVASGFMPTTSSRIWANEYDGWDGIEFTANIRIALGDPGDAVPLNEPPPIPYTMLPRSAIVQVTKEDEHFDVLLKHVPARGYGLLFITLEEHMPEGNRSKARVEICIDGERVGQLTPQMSQRFLPMIRHLRERGLATSCWSDITGSAVAAKLRIDAIKANQASTEVLNGTPITVAKLRPALPDPLAYDLSAMRSVLRPVPLVRPTTPPIPAEPPEGSVVRFDKGGGHYNYVAVRRGGAWETTATGSGGSIEEVMVWTNLARRVRKFDIAAEWDLVDGRSDPRVLERRAVVRFTICDMDFAAINIHVDEREDGDWYTTVTEQAEQQLPLGRRAIWSEIVSNGQRIQVVTAWAPVG